MANGSVTANANPLPAEAVANVPSHAMTVEVFLSLCERLDLDMFQCDELLGLVGSATAESAPAQIAA